MIVIDDYARDPEQIIGEAAELAFRPIGPNYPGVRAPVAAPLISAVRQSLAALIQQTFGIADQALNRVEAYYSLITTPARDLAPIQRLPHFDGLGATRIAVLHHLSRAERGGTAFFRHRSTGFETITAERLPAYNAAVNQEISRSGLPGPAYIASDTPLYEQIAHYPARFNRLLVYRGNALHSADVPADAPMTLDPRTGRFSINYFVWLEP